jgi:hypothetical protein
MKYLNMSFVVCAIVASPMAAYAGDNGCEVSGGDAFCAGDNNQWCNFSSGETGDCAPKAPNGSALPQDPRHMNPTLNGTCTPAAAMVVCLSEVCNSVTNTCGSPLGGSCADAGAGGCQSNVCLPNGTCGGCNTSIDCTNPSMPVCNANTHTCGPTMPPADAGPPPSDPGLDAGPPGVDAGLPDAARTPPRDASLPPPADGSAQVEASDDGYVEGGGCSVAPARAGEASSAAALLVGAAVALRAARRRRASRH